METVFSNAQIVTGDEVFTGSLKVVDGLIADMDRGAAPIPGALDCDGDYLFPGIVDLHTDNLEKHFEPRPGVTWDAVGAVVAHDGQMATAGITTVFDSLSVYGKKGHFDRTQNLVPMLDGLRAAVEQGNVRVDHKLHLRCEVSIPGLSANLLPHADHPLLGLLSIMDHTPGQRQYRNMTEDKFLEMLAAYNRTPEEIEIALKRFHERGSMDHAEDNRALIEEVSREREIPLASHDDETAEHIEQACDEGVTIAEFPVTLEAAKVSKERGLAVVMGAPNLLRGGSHSGNVSAADMADVGALDILASDYLPVSLLRAALMLTEAPFNWPLPKAIATVTAAPAEAVGLYDRGRLEPGRRADMIRVSSGQGDAWPRLRETWVAGKRVA